MPVDPGIHFCSLRMENSYRYWAHGCLLESELRIPELTLTDRAGAADLRITLTAGTPPTTGFGYSRRIDGFRLWWHGVAAFDIDATGDISVGRLCEDEDLLRLAILGGGLALALQFRNRFVFHGNAVSVGDAGVVIVGPKGAGKSTLTAALLAHGHHLLSDDLATVDFDRDDRARIHRGNLQLKLWPDSVKGCFHKDPEEFPNVFGEESKRRIPSRDLAASADSLPLRRVYILSDGPDISGHTLAAPAAWRESMAHSYSSRFGEELLHGPIAARHFAQCSQLVRAVPFVQLNRPRDFSRIGDVVRWIEADLAQG